MYVYVCYVLLYMLFIIYVLDYYILVFIYTQSIQIKFKLEESTRKTLLYWCLPKRLLMLAECDLKNVSSI